MRAMIALVALLIALVGCTQQQPEDIGARITHECRSLVDLTLRNEDGVKVVDTSTLRAELTRVGVAVPTLPVYVKPPPLPWNATDAVKDAAFKRWMADSAANADAVKKYDAAWAETEKHPEFNAAFDVVWTSAAKTAVYQCVIERAQKEGAPRVDR